MMLAARWKVGCRGGNRAARTPPGILVVKAWFGNGGTLCGMQFYDGAAVGSNAGGSCPTLRRDPDAACRAICGYSVRECSNILILYSHSPWIFTVIPACFWAPAAVGGGQCVYRQRNGRVEFAVSGLAVNWWADRARVRGSPRRQRRDEATERQGDEESN
jgi:hypothetical protein